MNDTEDRMLRALFAQSAAPTDGDAFVRNVMARVERQRRTERLANQMAVVCALLVAAVLSPWMGTFAQRGVSLLQSVLAHPFVVTQLTLAAGGLVLLLAAAFAAWASRN